jgi:hypothetical protein
MLRLEAGSNQGGSILTVYVGSILGMQMRSNRSAFLSNKLLSLQCSFFFLEIVSLVLSCIAGYHNKCGEQLPRHVPCWHDRPSSLSPPAHLPMQ